MFSPERILLTGPQILSADSAQLALIIQKRLESAGRKLPPPPPEESMCQNFLIDPTVIKTIADCVEPDSTVMEIGPGVGMLTQALAERSSQFVGVELDADFLPVLSDLHGDNPNASFVIGDALRTVDLARLEKESKLQIFSNLPFDIAKKFIGQIAGTPIHNAVFFLGDHIAREVHATNPNDADFGHLSIIANTYFDTEVKADVDPGCFYPMGETTGQVVIMTPKKPDESDPVTLAYAQIIKDMNTIVSGRRETLKPRTVQDSINITNARAGNPGSLVFDRSLAKPFMTMDRKEVKRLARRMPTLLHA